MPIDPILEGLLPSDEELTGDINSPNNIDAEMKNQLEMNVFMESGSQGASAYETWLSLGNIGTESDFLEWLIVSAFSVELDGEHPLFENGVINPVYIPHNVLVDVFEVESVNDLTGLINAEQGDIGIVSSVGYVYVLGSGGFDNLANWKLLPTPAAPVLSVAGKTGAVTLSVADILDIATHYYSKNDLNNGVLDNRYVRKEESVINNSLSHDLSSIKIIKYPLGSTYVNDTTNITGAVKIKLPIFYSSTMLKIHVSIYNYKNNSSYDLIISGYNFGGDNAWHRTGAISIQSQEDALNLPVRFGHDTVNTIIWIGDLVNVWDYIKVTIPKVEISFSGASLNVWNKNWNISITDTFDTVQSIKNNTNINRYIGNELIATRKWVEDNKNEYNVFNRNNEGLVPAPGGSSVTRYLREDGVWVVPPNDNDTYSSLLQADIDGSTTVDKLVSGKMLRDNFYIKSEVDDLIDTVSDNNYLTGVSGSGNGTVTFTRQGLGNLTWDASHTHTISQVTNLQTSLDSKVDKVSTASRVYGTDSSSVQTTFGISQTTNDLSVAQRYTDGRLRVGNAVENLDAVNKGLIDSTLVKLTDPRLTDARTPLAHTHTMSDIIGLESQFGNTYGNNLAMPDLAGKTDLGGGNYLLFSERGLTLSYNVFTGVFTREGELVGGSFEFPLLLNLQANQLVTISPYLITEGSVHTQIWEKPNRNLLGTGNNSFTFTTSSQFQYIFLNFNGVGGLEQFKLQIEKGTQATPYTIPLPFTRKELDDKLNKISTGGLRRIYGVNTSNTQEMLEVINTTKANTVPLRDTNGNFEIGNATADAHAINRITADGRYATTTHTHTISDVTNLQTSLNAKENTISAGTTAQYWRGDKTWQTLNKTAVGLGNVDNTSDLNKPISTATQLALNNKLDTITTSGLAAYTKNGSTQSSMTISSSASANTLASRTTGGRLKVSTATEDDDAVNKLQMVSYVDGVIESLPNALTYIGAWNANTNTPTLLANNLATKGHVYRVTVAGTRFSIAWEVNDLLVYNNDGNVEKWDITDPTGYEVMSNKITAWGTPTDLQYPSAKLVKDSLDGKLNTVSNVNRIYATDGTGLQTTYTAATAGTAYTIPVRGASGTLKVGSAADTNDAVPLGQLQTMIDEMFNIEIWESGD